MPQFGGRRATDKSARSPATELCEARAEEKNQERSVACVIDDGMGIPDTLVPGPYTISPQLTECIHGRLLAQQAVDHGAQLHRIDRLVQQLQTVGTCLEQRIRMRITAD
jgi:hypothetical protein